MKYILIIISTLFILNRSYAQVECNEDIYMSFINDSITLWEDYMKNMEKQYRVTNDIKCLYSLTFAQYGFIVFCIVSDQRDKGKLYLDIAYKNVNKLLKYDSLWPEIYSLKGALYGFKIEFNKFKAIKYGKKSIALINKAQELDSLNPKVWMEKGNLSYHIPKFLGGGIEKAIECHEKSIMLFKQDEEKLKYNWIYLLVNANLGRWLTENKELEKAKLLYEELLKYEPDFSWIKNKLYPDLLEEIK